MFIRSELKAKGKEALHRNLWVTIGVCIVVMLLSGSSNFVGANIDPYTQEATFYVGLGGAGGVSFNIFEMVIPMTIVSIVTLLGLLYTIFVANPLLVGEARYFLENREEPAKFEIIFDMFRKGTYLNVVKIMLLRDIFTLLWALLFIIPGVYKAYQYSMIPYILAENPTMDSADVFALTKILTNKTIFELFVLDLSFIPWSLLAIATCGIAVFYVIPYQNATKAEVYVFLRNHAIENGYITPENDEEEISEVEHVEPTIEDLY